MNPDQNYTCFNLLDKEEEAIRANLDEVLNWRLNFHVLSPIAGIINWLCLGATLKHLDKYPKCT
jgi:hypothetical protein